MGANPGVWLSGWGTSGAFLLVTMCLLVILGACAILVAAHKMKHREGEVRISWKEISVRWSQEKLQVQSEALEEAPDDTSPVDAPAAACEQIAPQGGDAA
jgi:hypothetical protein